MRRIKTNNLLIKNICSICVNFLPKNSMRHMCQFTCVVPYVSFTLLKKPTVYLNFLISIFTLILLIFLADKVYKTME
ncbi:MAG TPA: hypothetical protein PLI57_00980 [Spirochaetota bacterium]|nr:hypothetical protein [Spirochaetota bacterium]